MTTLLGSAKLNIIFLSVFFLIDVVSKELQYFRRNIYTLICSFSYCCALDKVISIFLFLFMKVSCFHVGSPWPTCIILEMDFRMCRSPAVGVAWLRGDGPDSRVVPLLHTVVTVLIAVFCVTLLCVRSELYEPAASKTLRGRFWSHLVAGKRHIWSFRVTRCMSWDREGWQDVTHGICPLSSPHSCGHCTEESLLGWGWRGMERVTGFRGGQWSLVSLCWGHNPSPTPHPPVL